MTLILATQNEHKVQELQAMLGQGLQLRTLQQMGHTTPLAETGHTLEANSLQKAQQVWDLLGLPCLADDTGLLVQALGGAPGVYSARYAGPQASHAQNVELLLQRMQGVAQRRACFRTVFTLIDAQGQVHQFSGQCDGYIVHAPMGQAGFGYDPVFEPEGLGHTMAQMSLAHKNAIGHRGKAMQALVHHLRATQ